jgi:oligoendopeptidase F
MNYFSNIKTNWDFEKTLGFKSILDPKIKKDLAKAKLESYKFIKKWKKDPSYLTSISSLKTALDEYEYWQANFATSSNVDYYLSLRQSLKQNSARISAFLNRVIFSSRHIENDIQFFLLNLSKVDKIQQRLFLKSVRLKPYKNFLKNIFLMGQYTLSDDQEKIINLKSQVSYSNWVKMTTRLLSKQVARVYNSSGTLKNLPFSSIYSLIDHPTQKIRQKASNSFTSILDQFSDVAESELNSVLENKMIDDQLRGYARPDSARLLSDDIDVQVVDTLIDTVTKNFKLSQLYYFQKARLLGKKTIDYSERNLSIGKVNKIYSSDRSIQIVNQVLEDLDPDFSKIFVSFLKNGQIDFFSKKGKTDGAFCSAGLKNATSFVLLNHNRKLRDVTTIAHEMGHAINNELTRSSQNALNFDTTLATAEVASTFFEDFVFKDIKSSLDKSQQLPLLVNKLDDEVATIFRQVALYNFETDLHRLFRKKGYLSKKTIGTLFLHHMTSYLGKSVNMTGFHNWWVYWSHIRRPFYVYSYSSGLLISKYLQSQVLKHPKYIKKVKTFLSSGTSQTPRKIFKSMGIDINQASFWQQGINDFADKLEQIRKSAV